MTRLDAMRALLALPIADDHQRLSHAIEGYERADAEKLTIKVKLNPDGGITDDDLTHFRIRVRSRFSLMWDSKFVFHEKRMVWADRDWLVRPSVKFVDSGQHLTVSLHKGKGLLDEYADASAPSRKVYDDHSIMGDYYKEGMTEATAKPRHGERLASIIGAVVDKNLTSKMR